MLLHEGSFLYEDQLRVVSTSPKIVKMVLSYNVPITYDEHAAGRAAAYRYGRQAAAAAGVPHNARHPRHRL